MLNGLDLFSGIGGLSIALNEWVRPIAYCEIDRYCQGVLLSQMARGNIRTAPIWDDVTTLDGGDFESEIDVIYGGFPCQGISVAGHGKGLADERSGLFFEIMRLAKEIQPKFIFLENVPAICSRGGPAILKEITTMGYDCRWCCISAQEYVNQIRERWFCLAKLDGQRWSERPSEGIQSKRQTIQYEKPCNHKFSDMECWAAFARSMRKDHGIPFRMERVRSLGNSVCPQQAKEAFKILMGIK